jgi:poly-gamma-glutamate capsule biosynthesis protein CapA/YwtB (metallophosphatase superfamily)
MQPMKTWRVALAGECMVTRPFSMHDEPEFRAVLDLLRTSDVTYAHLEMNLGEFAELDWPARGDWTGSYMMGDPRVADDLRWSGIDLVSLAQNHSVDFGAAGVMATIRHCKRAGLVHAGTGRDLEEAREPGYLETKQGRVALISVSSGNKSHEWAGLPKAGLRGRPGINPLRVSMKYVVDGDAAEQLRRIIRALDIGGGNQFATEAGEIRMSLPGDQSTRTGVVFVDGGRFEVVSTCHQRDLEGNLRSVNEAVTMADLVIVAHHFNISEGKRGNHPPSFARAFARACIDAGADIYVGHGWHRTLAIEIYRGRPIFYGMGNFFAQSEFIRRVPYDSYEAWGHDVDRLPTLTPAAYPLHPGLDASSELWWSSAIVSLTMKDRTVQEIRLHPVEMGRDVTPEARVRRPTGHGPHALTEGRPVLADRENGDRILERLTKLSAEYGTTIDVEDGLGIVRL